MKPLASIRATAPKVTALKASAVLRGWRMRLRRAIRGRVQTKCIGVRKAGGVPRPRWGSIALPEETTHDAAGTVETGTSGASPAERFDYGQAFARNRGW